MLKQTVLTVENNLNNILIDEKPSTGKLTRFDLHDHWLAVLISHLPDVQQFMGITIVSGPAVHKYPRATAATVHHQAIVQVGVACICCIHISHSSQVPFEPQRFVNVDVTLPAFIKTQTVQEQLLGYLWK